MQTHAYAYVFTYAYHAHIAQTGQSGCICMTQLMIRVTACFVSLRVSLRHEASHAFHIPVNKYSATNEFQAYFILYLT